MTSPHQRESAASFPLLLRIPTWSNISRMVVRINGGDRISPLQTDPKLTSFVRIERVWKDSDSISVDLGMEIVAKKGVTVNSGWTNSTAGPDSGDSTTAHESMENKYGHGHGHMLGGGHMNNTGDLPFCTVERGPLLFVLPLEPDGGARQFNYALECDASSMQLADTPGIRPGTSFNWPLEGAPVQIAAKAALFDWTDIGLLPAAPVSTAAKAEKLILVPYGCSQLYRLAMFPFIDQK
jgi:hypothetical protein